MSVCSDKVGNLFVADTFNDRIAVFSGDSGAWKFNFGSSGKSNGENIHRFSTTGLIS